MATKTRPPGALAVGERHEVVIGDLLTNGQGVGRVNGVAVFVWGPLPGERARIVITLVKAKYAVAELVELLERSPRRVAPFCPVFGTCGGCQVQHLAYEAQLEWKRSIVRSALQRIGGIADPRVAAAIGMDEPRAYRNKVALVAARRAGGDGAAGGGAGGELAFGFYQARSHALVPVDGCPVTLPRLDAMIRAVVDLGADPELGAAFTGVRHVVARTGRASGETVVSFTTDRPSPLLGRLAPRLAARLPGAVGLANTHEPASANAVMGRATTQLWGSPEMEERIDDARFRVSASSFFQVNSAMVARIFAFMRPGLRRGAPPVLDLYCGAGTFSIFFALAGASRVIGVEENPSAVREARANAQLNGVAGRTRFVAGLAERLLRAPDGRRALADAGLVFLDPPRKGSDEATLGALADARVPTIWYLSCNPATLARDLAHLVRRGYALDFAQPFDMFPQTGHVETLAVLRRDDGVAPLLELPARAAERGSSPAADRGDGASWPVEELPPSLDSPFRELVPDLVIKE